MKRLVIVSIFVLAVLMVSVPLSAATIDLISQTYSIDGTVYTPIGLPGTSVDITSTVPPLIAPFPSPIDLHANGGASGSSAFADVGANSSGLSGGFFPNASADLVFKTIGASYLDLSYSADGFGTGSSHITLLDSTTGVTLVTVLGHDFDIVHDYTSGITLLPAPKNGDIYIPVVSSDIYRLSVSASSDSDPAQARATLTAVPEPSTLLFFCSGLVGLVGLRRRLGK